MFTWNKNNRACTTTWSTLLILDQINAAFIDSSAIQIRDFTFWNKTGSSDMRNVLANTLAIQMDNIFTIIRGAQYENGVTKETAINGIMNILSVGDQTVSDLAELNNRNYVFWNGDNPREN
jgi:hypothetical protein